MEADHGPVARLRHHLLPIEDVAIHVAEGGAPSGPTTVFLHGWPQCWAAFEGIMARLDSGVHMLALDLPGIGGSSPPPASNDKRTIARLVRGVIRQLATGDVTLVGHDVGGQIVYAYLHAFPCELKRAVMMNIAVPGVDPWDEVERNPDIWHFAFHNVPGLPEQLVTDHQREYFGFFYDILTARPEAIDEQQRKLYAAAYARPDALATGFGWYRAFAEDEKVNREVSDRPIPTPVLYLRGECEGGDLARYLRGFRERGLANVEGQLIPGSGHFAPDERPDEVAAALRGFIAGA